MGSKLFLKLYGIIVLSSLGLFTLTAVLIMPVLETRLLNAALDRDSINDASGAFFLLESVLEHQPQSNWRDQLARFPRDANFRVEVFQRNNLPFSGQQRQRLSNGEIVLDEQVIADFVAFEAVDDEWVMAISDLAVSDELQNLETRLQLATNAFAGLLFLLTTGLVLRYLHYRLQPLDRFAEQLSTGRFTAKLPTKSQDDIGLMFTRLNDSASRLAQLIATRKSLVDGVGHDLRTPLSRIRFLLASIENHDTALTDIRRNLDEIDTTIQSTLQFARLDQVVTTEKVELNSWLAKILAPYESTDLMVNLALSSEPDATSQLAKIQPDLMKRAVINVLENAKTHTTSQISVALIATNESWRITIDDDGPGFSETVSPRLGLTIVSAVMQIHKGSMECVQSSLGGARVVLSWPTDATT